MTNAHTLIATAENFLTHVVEGSKSAPVLVDFWAEWCEPCKQLLPILDRLASEYAGRFVLAKVNADEQPALTQQLGVRSLPTVVLFKNGEVVDNFVGVVPEAQIREMLDRHLPALLPALQKTFAQKARELKIAGDFTAAQLILDQALVGDPTSIELQCELAEVKALNGDLDSAKQILSTVQSREPTAHPVKRLAAFVEFSDVVRANPDTHAIKQRLAADPQDLDSRHALAVHRLLAADYDAALEDWLDIMRSNRKYKDDLARKSLVMAFELIGNTDPRVAQTRREMARMLF